MRKIYVSKRHRIQLFRRLALYLEVGMSLLHGLESTRMYVRTSNVRTLISLCEENIKQGKPLSTAFRLAGSFDPFTLGLLSVGETTGNLAKACKQIAEFSEDQESLTQKFIGISIYPAIVLIATGGIALFLILYVFPKILPILEGFHTALPWPTQVILFISTFLQKSWVALLVILVLSISAMPLLVRYYRIRIYLELLSTQIPFINRLFRTYHLARLFLTLSMVYGSGTPIITSLAITEQSTSSILYGEQLKRVSEQVQHGNHIATVFGQYKNLFPEIITQLLSVGEETGTLHHSLDSLARIFREDLDGMTRMASVLIEPVLMVVMGLIVGIIALAIIMPMYQITSSLNS